MTPDRETANRFDDLVRTAIRDRKAGRAEIVSQLAALPLEKLASVPPSALASIGPRGLAVLAARRADLAGLAPKAETKREVPATASAAVPRNRNKHRAFLPTLWLCCGIVLVAMSFEPAAVLMRGMSSDDLLSRNENSWPRCHRLDQFTDGCVYRTSAPSLTFRRAATYLRMDVSDLTRLNPHLIASSTTPLATGSLIVVLRDIARISGETQ